jgi:dipeptidyl aminopeptidase/acylaminoacyl peptidase
MTLHVISSYPARFAAAIDLFGISDMQTFLRTTAPFRQKNRMLEYGSDPQLLRSLSPIHRACSITASLLVVQGKNDIRVPVSESKKIVDEVTRCGGSVEGLFLDGEGHGFINQNAKVAVAMRMVQFLARTLLHIDLEDICDDDEI